MSDELERVKLEPEEATDSIEREREDADDADFEGHVMTSGDEKNTVEKHTVEKHTVE